MLETKYVQDKSIFGGGYIKAKVRANDVIKGKVARVFTVIDELPEGGMCTSFLRAGVEFVLFVDDRHEVGMCSGTRPLGATIHDRSEKLREVRRLSAGKS